MQQNNQHQSNQPLDKGRVCVVVGQYPSGQHDPQSGEPIMKNRYAAVGRATLWSSNQGSTAPNIQTELETMPIGISGPVNLVYFWDSESQRTQR